MSTAIVVSTGLNMVQYLSSLQDVDNYSGQFNKIARVKADNSGIEWVDVEQTAITATGASTERTIADIFGDIVNVKNFGAKGDGVTGDTQAFLDADAGSPTGAAIYIPVTGNNYVLDGTTDLSSIKTISFGTIFFDISSGSTPPTHVNLIP